MWDDTRELNAIAATLALIACAFLTWAILGWAARLPLFAIRHVVVTTPPVRTNPAWVASVVRGELSGTFFSMDLGAARAALARIPWVKSVALRRQWPDRLEVELVEHQPLARWNQQGLVDTGGAVFVASYAGELPEFDGPDGEAPTMVERYREWAPLLAGLSLRLTGLVLSPRGGWQIRAESGNGPLAIELGRDHADERLKRFATAWGRTLGVLAREGRHVDRVDLRYRNGFAARLPDFHPKRARRAT
ncbi:MAG: cell division protein FtsQ/DivIB [Casimicrobiaceae bacterium]